MEFEGTFTPIEIPKEPVRYPVKFHGQAGEYFQIWFVNLLLTIVTFGIYSAWAKVRTMRYLYGQTELDSSRFEYTGDPLKILIGRMMMAALFGIYYVWAYIHPVSAIFAVPVLYIGMPFLLVNGMAYRMRNSIFRGIRFHFHRDYAGAYIFYFVHVMVLCGVTLGLYAPAAVRRYYGYISENLSFGSLKAKTGLTTGEVYGLAMLFILPIVVVAGILFASKKTVFMALGGTGFLVLFFAAYFFVLAMVPLFMWSVRRRFWNTTAFETIRFESTVSPGQLLWIHATNLILILLTVGLIYPWARIRTLKYLTSNLTVIAPEGATDAIAQNPQGAEVNAVGEASIELWDFDFGL